MRDSHSWCIAEADSAVLYARMFGPLIGISEDPATGSSSACCLAGRLRIQRICFASGADMGRPSVLHLAQQRRVEAQGSGRCRS